jgi:hypothetical protein
MQPSPSRWVYVCSHAQGCRGICVYSVGFGDICAVLGALKADLVYRFVGNGSGLGDRVSKTNNAEDTATGCHEMFGFLGSARVEDENVLATCLRKA